jgi:hypothetical protein
MCFNQIINIMAKPIKITPVLRSKDAAVFYKKLEENKTSKVSTARIMQIRETANQFKAILKK